MMKYLHTNTLLCIALISLAACSPKESPQPAQQNPVAITDSITDTAPAIAASLSMNKDWMGQWTAVSNNYMGITGDMAVGHRELSWVKLGNIAYEMVYAGENYILVKLQQEVVCGTYLKLGPTRQASGYTDIEVTFYSELPAELQQADTFKSRSEWMADIENSCSSGMFSRDQN